MAKYVIIDSDKETVYVGTDTNHNTETALIDYQSGQNTGILEKHFFERWKITHEMILEFVFLGNNNKPRFCLKGFWEGNQWIHLFTAHTNNIFIFGPH